MAIQVSCVCGKQLSVKDEFTGRKLKCPACQNLLKVPASEEFSEDEFADEPDELSQTARGREKSTPRGKGSKKGKKSSGSNRGLLIGLMAGGGVLVVGLLAWLLWPAGPDVVAEAPAANSAETPASESGEKPNGNVSAMPGGANEPHAKFSQFTDGMSETLLAGMVAENHAVPWTMPGDIMLDETFPSKDCTFVDGAVMHADGSIRHTRFREGMNRDSLRALFTINGRETSPMNSLYPPGLDLTDPQYATTQEYVRHSEARSQNKNSLKAIAVAFHKYHEAKQHLPPATVFGSDGKPWHSWRVLILPYLGHQTLYDEYDQSVPWNDPKNAAVLAKMPTEYRDPLSNNPNDNQTIYLVVAGHGTGFPTGNAAKHEPRSAPPASVAMTNGSEPSPPKGTPDADAASDLQALQGTWRVSDVAVPPELPKDEAAAMIAQVKQMTWTIKDNVLTMTNPLSSMLFTIKLDPTQAPKTIDLIPVDGKFPLSVGLYSIEGETWQLCMTVNSKDRPPVMKADQAMLLTFQRGSATDAAPASRFDIKAWQAAEGQLKAMKVFAIMDSVAGQPGVEEGITHVVIISPPETADGTLSPKLWAIVSSLSHVIIRPTFTTDATLQQVSQHPGLVGLNLSGRFSVTPTGIAYLKPCSHLRGLYFSEVPVTAELLTAVSQLTQLRNFGIYKSPVSSEMLGSIVQLNQLESLSLQETGLTDADAVQIAQLTKLKSLLLNGSKLTDAGLKTLHSLKELTHFDVRGIAVTPQAVAEFEAALPKCKVLK